MNFDIYKLAEKKIITVAHRGLFAGNIPCNTIPAFNAALTEGADMIELDVDMSRDGKLVIFHPGMERAFLGTDKKIPELDFDEVRKLRYINYDNTPTEYPVATFDEVMEAFRGRCFINVDKFWMHPKEIYDAIKRHGVEDQVIIKSAWESGVGDILSDLGCDLAYMPIVKGSHPSHNELMKSGINYIGAEVLFDSEDSEVASPEFIDMMHRDGKLIWANAIIYNYKAQLTARHSDDAAILGDPDFGWGWLARRGFDIIQTDWVGMMSRYLDSKGLLYKAK